MTTRKIALTISSLFNVKSKRKWINGQLQVVYPLRMLQADEHEKNDLMLVFPDYVSVIENSDNVLRVKFQ